MTNAVPLETSGARATSSSDATARERLASSSASFLDAAAGSFERAAGPPGGSSSCVVVTHGGEKPSYMAVTWRLHGGYVTVPRRLELLLRQLELLDLLQELDVSLALSTNFD